ncbi:MAG: hypothetical protein IJI67_09820 [Clostridia bacterium]|nr:hypothetical protein [Clostridia bacterium]
MAYQNVSFSAGETLTATKMNQMAANDAAFHDGTGIAAGAITADKIDFTTFIKFSPGISNITLSGPTEIANAIVPETGTYVILGIGAISGGSGDYSTWELYKNATLIGQTYVDSGTRSQATLITQASLTKNDTISLKCSFDGGQTLTRPNGILLMKIS